MNNNDVILSIAEANEGEETTDDIGSALEEI